MQLLFGSLEYHSRFGFIRVGSWKLRWRRTWLWTTCLFLRWGYRRLAFVSGHPIREGLRALCPFPLQWPCPPLPPPPRVILANPKPYVARYYEYDHAQHEFPLWTRRDTLQRTFFRLYEAICAADDVMIGYVTEYMFFRPEPEWALHLIADPRTMAASPSDPTDDKSTAERLAVMARLVIAVEKAFNWRLELGLRRDRTVVEHGPGPDYKPAPWIPEIRPSWADEIQPLPELLVLSHTWKWPENVSPDWVPSYNIVIQGGALRTV